MDVGLRCGEEGVGDHEVVGVVFGGVGPEDELVDCERWVGVRLRGGGDPMDGERRPFERVGDDEVIQKRSVLLPDGVLFLNEGHVFLVLIVGHGCGCGWISEPFPLLSDSSRQNVGSEKKSARVRTAKKGL